MKVVCVILEHFKFMDMMSTPDIYTKPAVHCPDVAMEQIGSDEALNLEGYGPRHIFALEENDVLIAFKKHKEAIQSLHGFYKRKFGIRLGNEESFVYLDSNGKKTLTEVLHSEKHVLRQYRDHLFVPFIQNETFTEISESVGGILDADYRQTDKLNANSSFYELMLEKGIPVPEGRVIEGPMGFYDFCMENGIADEYVLKLDRGASGIGVTIGPTHELIEKVVANQGKQLLQKKVDLACAPSVIFNRTIEGMEGEMASFQLMEGESHLGNIEVLKFLKNKLVRFIMARYAEVLSELDIYGNGGVDFLLKKGGGLKRFNKLNRELIEVEAAMQEILTMAEANMRTTGFTQFRDTKNKLEKVGFSFEGKTIGGMNISGISGFSYDEILEIMNEPEFDISENGTGIVINNLCCLDEGKIMVFISANDIDHFLEIRSKLEERLKTGKDVSLQNLEFADAYKDFEAAC